MPLLPEIAAEIRRQGPITFARYMELCLYHPHYGYYRSARERFGAHGDFYTSAQVHHGFARLLVRRWAEMWRVLGGGEFVVLEVGAGRGDVGREAQAWAKRAHPEFSRDLRYLSFEYGDRLPKSIRGCIFSNEFFDAQPTHVLRLTGGQVREWYVGERQGKLAWSEGEPSCPELEAWLRRLGIAPGEENDGRLVELSLAAADWMRRFAGLLERGYVLSFDYGYRTHEIARLPQGSLMTYRLHAATAEIFRDPGERDITAHVNFDLLIEAGRQAGLRDLRLCSQGRYLMELGEAGQFKEVFADCASEAERVKVTLLLKNLLFGLGDTVQVLEQEKSSDF